MKFEGDTETSEAFTYTHVQNSGRISADVCDWLPLSPKNVSQRHIRYHELPSEEIFMNFEVKSAVAVVVVNTNDDRHLPKYLTPPDQIPVIVVASSVGQKVQQFWSCQVSRNVLCKIFPTINSKLCKGMLT